MSLDEYLLKEVPKDQDKEDEIAAFLSSSRNESGSFSSCLENVSVEGNSTSSSVKLTPKRLKKQETDIDDVSTGTEIETIRNSGNSLDLQNFTMVNILYVIYNFSKRMIYIFYNLNILQLFFIRSSTVVELLS